MDMAGNDMKAHEVTYAGSSTLLKWAVPLSPDRRPRRPADLLTGAVSGPMQDRGPEGNGPPARRRVAATPETVKKFIALGATLAVEGGAGLTAVDRRRRLRGGGRQVGDRAASVAGADIVLGVQGPDPALLAGAKPGAWLVAGLDPFGERERVDAYAAAGLEALAMEFMPRITRAQSMDILSSQSNLAGYKAVLDAADVYGRAFPMMMTAAGTISAAQVFVMGVGVAGLQAIATARRLGAQVSATDVRAATKEQIQSLGAKPIFVENVAGIEGEGAGGYATEMSEEYQKAQAELVSSHIAKQDIVITTALIPGRAAPRLITDAQIADDEARQRDLRSRRGAGRQCRGLGRGPGGRAPRREDHRLSNTPAHLAADASALFSRNLFNFLSAFWDKEPGGRCWTRRSATRSG